MVDWNDVRQLALNRIINILREIDRYNREHSDALILDKEKLIVSIAQEFNCTMKTANSWIDEAMKMNKNHHEQSLDTEFMIRKAVAGSTIEGLDGESKLS